MTPRTSHNLLHLGHTHTAQKTCLVPVRVRETEAHRIKHTPTLLSWGQRQDSNAAPTLQTHACATCLAQGLHLPQESQVTSCPRGEGWAYEGRGGTISWPAYYEATLQGTPLGRLQRPVLSSRPRQEGKPSTNLRPPAQVSSTRRRRDAASSQSRI